MSAKQAAEEGRKGWKVSEKATGALRSVPFAVPVGPGHRSLVPLLVVQRLIRTGKLRIEPHLPLIRARMQPPALALTIYPLIRLTGQHGHGQKDHQQKRREKFRHCARKRPPFFPRKKSKFLNDCREPRKNYTEPLTLRYGGSFFYRLFLWPKNKIHTKNS